MLEYLAFWYQVIVASEPLLEEAIARLGNDGFEGDLKGFYIKHLEDERHHAQWLREDIGPEAIDFRIEAARLAGVQYYLVKHLHPVCLMGYMMVLEGTPPQPGFVELAKKELGPRARTLLLHAEEDPRHIEELRAFPIPEEYAGMVEMSRQETIKLIESL